MPEYGESILKDIGRSYVVSSLLPATMFVLLASVLFGDIIPGYTLTDLFKADPVISGSVAAGLMIFSTWIGFALYSAQNYIVPLFEGYLLPGWIKNYLINRNFKTYNKNYKKKLEVICDKLKMRQEIFDKISHTDKENDIKRLNNKIKNIQMSIYEELLDIERYIPIKKEVLQPCFYKDTDQIIQKDSILPTRLGNILRMGEYYPGTRYGFDGIAIWTRLHAVLPASFLSHLEELNNRLTFLLNSTFSLCVLAITSLITSMMFLLNAVSNWRFVLSGNILNCKYSITGNDVIFFCPKNIIYPGYEFFLIKSLTFFGIFLLLLLGSYGLYFFGVKSAEDFSTVVASAYDLYRFELLEQLHIKLPDDLIKEQNQWKELNWFYLMGANVDLDYDHLSREKKVTGNPEEPEQPEST